jgi:cytochrome c oxidase subunit III
MQQRPSGLRARLNPDFQFWPSAYQIGILVALASVSVFFIALVVAYSFAVGSQTFRGRVDVPPLLWLSTGILMASSITLERARLSLLTARARGYPRMVRFTLILGVAFLISQTLAGIQLYADGVFVYGNPHGSMFYMFTGVHALHLLGGIVWIGYLLYRSTAMHEISESELRRRRSLAGVAAVYWHFMGLLWLCLFAVLYRWA